MTPARLTMWLPWRDSDLRDSTDQTTSESQSERRHGRLGVTVR